MPSYVILINWTDQGIKNFNVTTERAQDFTNLVEKAGGHVREILWTVGDYDLTCVLEAADDETVAATLLQVGALGNIRTKTMRAFNAEEMARVLERAR
jgi:uncharacterized protein with GYD domain